VEISENYRVKISYGYTDLENLVENGDINRA